MNTRVPRHGELWSHRSGNMGCDEGSNTSLHLIIDVETDAVIQSESWLTTCVLVTDTMRLGADACHTSYRAGWTIDTLFRTDARPRWKLVQEAAGT